jgi:hypothetical protein
VRCGRLIAATFGLLALAGCVRHLGPAYRRSPTGTCPGACEHYLLCKGTPDDRETMSACVDECRAIYDDASVLAAYERLECEKAVAFIEGSSGRGPGARTAAE